MMTFSLHCYFNFSLKLSLPLNFLVQLCIIYFDMHAIENEIVRTATIQQCSRNFITRTSLERKIPLEPLRKGRKFADANLTIY